MLSAYVLACLNVASTCLWSRGSEPPVTAKVVDGDGAVTMSCCQRPLRKSAAYRRQLDSNQTTDLVVPDSTTEQRRLAYTILGFVILGL